MAPSKNRCAPAAESPPPVQDPPSASANISSVPSLHMRPNAYFTCDAKLYKLLETIHEAFHDLYIRWAMASTFRTASNEVNVEGYEVPPEYLQFMLSVSCLADKLRHLSFITLPSFLKNYYSSDDIDKLKETLGNNYWERLPLPPKKPSSVKTSKVSSVRIRRVQSPVVVKKEVGTDKCAREPSPGPVNKKPKLDIYPTNTLFGSKSGESEATVEEDIEEVEVKCDELEDINQFSGDKAVEESPLSSVPTHGLEPAPSVTASSKGKGKAKAVTAPSKVVKKKTNATASVSEEQPNLHVIYIPGTEAAPVTFEQLAILSTAVYKKCSVVQNLNDVLLVFNRLFQIGLQGPEGLGMLLSQRTQLVESCHRISGIRVLLDMDVNCIHTQINELTATIKHATHCNDSNAKYPR
ncbi:hypothetical protein L218DRAFT_1056526 [Marasmius fiardii PR-910]|nr:hypothetical protein L218DRAFT_1056526 [Marasmius fiardii PR-910]